MNHKFDELAKGLAQSVTWRQPRRLSGFGGGMALACLVAMTAGAQSSQLGPLVKLSQPNPVGTCDDGFRVGGATFTLNDATEPNITVNPLNPNNVVASWILGPAQNIISGVSFDGGRNWSQAPIPVTVCSGGPLIGVTEPWVSFGPNGELYVVNIAGMTGPQGVYVNKSTDGGLHWSAPLIIPGTSNAAPFDPTITADRTDARFAYAAWKRTDDKNEYPAVFSRTTDGGLTWETARIIFQPPQHSFSDINQIFVLQDGTLVDLFFLYSQAPNGTIKGQNVAALRSTDKGQTWSAPILGPATTPLFQPNGDDLITDPETGVLLDDPGQPAYSQDPATGTLYAVWEDARFSNFQYIEIAFSMSTDGGLTWSNPIRVNQTPSNIPPPNRQAFLPSVAVNADGTIAVSYYDFRFNDPSPGLPTDYWMVQCHPSATAPATNPANWGNEVRLTGSSFNLEACVQLGGEFFLGYYIGGIAGSGKGFVATFTAVDQNGVTSIFARRVGP